MTLASTWYLSICHGYRSNNKCRHYILQHSEGVLKMTCGLYILLGEYIPTYTSTCVSIEKWIVFAPVPLALSHHPWFSFLTFSFESLSSTFFFFPRFFFWVLHDGTCALDRTDMHQHTLIHLWIVFMNVLFDVNCQSMGTPCFLALHASGN